MTTLVIADDQGMVRAGFRSLLDAEPDLTVVGDAAAMTARRPSKWYAAPLPT
jgi:DNA-binding NarL/FixJ family response regulator